MIFYTVVDIFQWEYCHKPNVGNLSRVKKMLYDLKTLIQIILMNYYLNKQNKNNFKV